MSTLSINPDDIPSGMDGHKPVWEGPYWTQRSRDDIYEGREGLNAKGYPRFVANVGDWVQDLPFGSDLYVASVDPVTFVPLLLPRTDDSGPSNIIENPSRFFIGNGFVFGCEKTIFYDDSTSIPTLAIPIQMHIQSLQAHHIKAFRGTNTTASGIEVSARYDNAGRLIGTDIPLQLVKQGDSTNETQWAVPQFYCSHQLTVGEQIVIVVYDEKGGFVGREGFIVEESATMRDVGDADLYVESISLESFYISSSDENTLLIPEKTLKTSINLFGRVRYTNGSSKLYPVDSVRFELLYVDRAGESVAGTKGSLVLKYHLQDNEKSVNVINNESEYFITRVYKYLITERDMAYSVKLYPVPVWVNAAVGYTLDWYLFSLDRNQWINVSSMVYIADNSPNKVFNGKLYGPLQQLNVAIDLGKVNQTFERFIHPQQVDITLLRPASDDLGDKWLIGYEPYQDPPYGRGLKVSVQTRSSTQFALNIANGYTTQDSWLQAVYRNTLPQYRTAREPEAPKPNMFAIIVSNAGNEYRYDYPLAKWNTALVIPTPLKNTDTVKILFFTRYADNDATLALAPMSVFME